MTPLRDSPVTSKAPGRMARDLAACQDSDPPPHRKRLRFRAIWISDFHLGTPGCQAGALLEFLRRTESEYLYLVGNIIDGWQLKRRWYWHQTHNDVVQKLLRKARKGTRVVYIPGHRDEAARHYLGIELGGIAVCGEAVHTTAQGKRLLVTHGGVFDGAVQCTRWVALLGDLLCAAALRINRRFDALRARMGLPCGSLSRFLDHKAKSAVSRITVFENALAREAVARGLDGVVCGHIRKAEIREIDGMLYCNDGDWVESLTALAEDAAGNLSILNWQAVLAATGVAERVPSLRDGVPEVSLSRFVVRGNTLVPAPDVKGVPSV
jgi:UDP-2,3-diacylglucosamine pyrophosphatase LpxH